MKGILDIRIFFIAAVLVIAMACQQTTDPATEPSKDAETAAAQASIDLVGEAETPVDAAKPDIADYMDEATARLFEQMNDEWQTMALDGWRDVTKSAPREDWAQTAQDIIPKVYAQAKIQGGIFGVPVAGVQDLVDPSKGDSLDNPHSWG